MDRQPSTRWRTPRAKDATVAPDKTGLDDEDLSGLSRRKILKRAVGLAAVGAVGGTVLTEALASPAGAATTTEVGGLAPAVVSLTDAATIAVNASLGNDFRLTIGNNRIMGNPTSPVDGQKIVFQITQGPGAPYTLTWGSNYSFSTALPQPTLSTTAGQTDLLAFIYNAAKGTWLFAAFVAGFNAPSGNNNKSGTFRLFSATAGPTTPVAYSGPFLSGVLFEATTGGTWLDGYWWWVCPSGQSTAPQKFALWAVYNGGTGSLVPAATVTSGPLTAGQWNYVPLANPVPLAIGACYSACTGFSGPFPYSDGQYGSAGPYSAGIVNGPLSAFSDQSGTLAGPFNMSQGGFSVAGTDPAVNMAVEGSNSSNFWMDVQIDTNAPAGTSYRLWPSYPTLPGVASGDTTAYTLATEFQLMSSRTLNKIWFYSASGATALPARCGIWNTNTQTVVAGTDNTSPQWSGLAGSGWVSCAYSGVTLPAGDYKVAVWSGGGAKWYLPTLGYWGTNGAGGNGITAGPLTAPGLSAAQGPGQSTYNPGTWAYPLTYGDGSNGENFWVDIEVT
jgi:hypothetical protein